jgi:hypothetical protein
MPSRITWTNAVLTLSGLLLCGATLAAQTGQAELRGTVYDEAGAALPGVAVTATNIDTGAVRSTVTSQTGTYQMPALPIGRYTLKAELTGFTTVTREGLRLGVGESASINLTMMIATVEETITVVGEAPLVETTKSTLAGRVEPKQVENLPLNGRSWSDLVALVPGARGNPGNVIAGAAGGDAAKYQMDGLGVTGAGTGVERQEYSSEAIAEFQVLTNRFDAEYGRVTGAVVNAVTKSGTNTIRGSGYLYLRQDWWDAKNTFLETVPVVDVKQTGATLGGPIVRDKSHFFASYEYHKDAFTSAPSTGYAEFDKTFDSSTIYNYLTARNDTQIGNAHRLFLRGSLYTWDIKNGGIGGRSTQEAGYSWPATIYDVAVGHTWVVNNQTVNEIRAGMWAEDKSIDVNLAHARYTFPSIILGPPSNMPQYWKENIFQFNDSLSYFKPNWLGEHRFKTGAQFTYQFYRGSLPTVSYGIFTFLTDPDNPRDETTFPTPRSYTVELGDFYYEMKNPIYGFFAQDDWSITPKLTLNLGVRYDIEPKVFPDTPSPIGESAPELDSDNIAPRVGFAYDLFADGRSVVRGGIGRYYGNILLDVIAQQLRNDERLSVTIVNPSLTDPLGGRGYQDFVDDPTIPKNTWVVAPDYKTPMTDQLSIGFAQQIGERLAVQADYVRARTENTPLYWNGNLFPDPNNPRLPCDPNVCGLPYPEFRIVRYQASRGRWEYDGLQVGLQLRRGSSPFELQGSYTLSKSQGHADANRYGYILNQFDLDDSFSRLAKDQRHRLTLNGTAYLPWDTQVSAILLTGSTYPLDAFTTDDPFNTLWTGRWLPDGTTIPKYGFSYDKKDIKLDLRVRKGVSLARLRAQVILDVFNVFNRTNYGTFQTFYSSSAFLQPRYSSARFYQNRQFQLGFRVDF